MTAVRFPQEPESGVDYKVPVDVLLELVRRTVGDYEWRFRRNGRASIIIYRTPREIRQDAGEDIGALV